MTDAQVPAAWTVHRKPSTPSTQDDARELARAGAPDRTAVVTEEQTRGRGTNGRTWAGPRGGLYASFVLRNVHNPHLVTLALGNAVADVLEVAGTEAQLKWVNDVHVAGKKIAGILVEAESTGARFDFLVCGIGINVNGHAADFPGELRAAATTLEDELGCDACVPDLETVLWQSIDRWLATLADHPEEVVAAFRARDALRGRRVRVDTLGGPVTGVADGIDDEGHLVVRDGPRTAKANGGTVTLL